MYSKRFGHSLISWYYSHVLQQPSPYSCPPCRIFVPRGLVLCKPGKELSSRAALYHNLGNDLLRHVCGIHFLYPGLVSARWNLYYLQYGRRPKQATPVYSRSCVFRCAGYIWQCKRHYMWICEWNRVYIGEAAAKR